MATLRAEHAELKEELDRERLKKLAEIKRSETAKAGAVSKLEEILDNYCSLPLIRVFQIEMIFQIEMLIQLKMI